MFWSFLGVENTVCQGLLHVQSLISIVAMLLNPIPHGGGGGAGADSTLFQIVFFITSVRDAAEPRNLVTFPKI